MSEPMTTPPVLTSPLLDALPGVRHAFFSRHGGVSTGLYASLNVGLGSRDDRRAVVENRRRAAAHFGAEPNALSTCYQIHSAATVVATSPWGDKRQEGDGVATRMPGVLCGALSADCAPILMADAQAGVVAAVHAGWRGALGGVVASAVDSMTGLDFLDTFTAQAQGSVRFFSEGASADKRQFDLPGFVLDRLARAGVETAGWIGVDTCADPDFFSNRRAVQRGEGDYGRLLSAIMLT
jgi:copper oxidase (laccase) domain-containing protein